MGIPDDRELLVIRDRFTGVIQAYPLKSKNTGDIVLCIKRFIGNRSHPCIFRPSATIREGMQGTEDYTRHFRTWEESH